MSWFGALSANPLLIKLSQNPVLVLASIGLSIAGFILAILFYLWSKKEREPLYACVSRVVARSPLVERPDLKLTLDGEPCDRVTLTRIIFWNAGRLTINQEDIAPAAPLQAGVSTTDGIRVIDAKLTQSSDVSCNVHITAPLNVEQDKATVGFSFDYLDQNDFCMFEFLHTGHGATPAGVNGKIKGCKKIRQLLFAQENFSAAFLFGPLTLGVSIAGLRGAFPIPKPIITLGILINLAVGGFALFDIISGSSQWWLWPIMIVEFLLSYTLYQAVRSHIPKEIVRNLFDSDAAHQYWDLRSASLDNRDQREAWMTH